MSRIRLMLIVGLVTLAGGAGCRQHVFMTQKDFQHYRHMALEPVGTTAIHEPSPYSVPVVPVSHVNALQAKKRYIALAECVALALENGRDGSFFDRAVPLRFFGGASEVTDSIRIFAYDPAVFGAEIEQSLSAFDARWQTSMIWSKVDRPVGSALDSFQAGFAGANAIQQDTAQFNSELVKPLPTGGLAGITFRTDYELSNLSPRVNPAYRPTFELSFEQPLLQGAGVGINQISDRHPGGQRLGPIQRQFGGILLTRIRYDQAQAEFERRVQELLLAVETAYWDLYCAYWDLYSRETAMRQAHIAWQIADVRFKTGSVNVMDYKQIEEQYHLFRAQRVQALGRGTQRAGVLEAERRLRYILGLPYEDGTRLIPLDTPTVAPYVPNWEVALNEAMQYRPELLQVRLEIQASQLAILREQDRTLPDIRFVAAYDVNALGKNLDSSNLNGALHALADNDFNSWRAGITADLILGYREAHAEVRKQKLRHAQRMLFLMDTENRIAVSLQGRYREVIQFYEEIRIQRARRLAAATQLEGRYQEFQSGRARIDVLLEAQRNWADALRDEHFAICDYNKALAQFEREKGTILRHDNVAIVDGPLPACAVERASEHIRERSRALVLKDPGDCDACVQEASFSVPLAEQTLPEAAPKLLVPKVTEGDLPTPLPAIVEKVGQVPPLPEKSELKKAKATKP